MISTHFTAVTSSSLTFNRFLHDVRPNGHEEVNDEEPEGHEGNKVVELIRAVHHKTQHNHQKVPPEYHLHKQEKQTGC